MNDSNLSSLPGLQLAAERGDARAQFLLGARYREGNGVQQDDAAAFHWIRASAEQGHCGAQNDLGVMYGRGAGVGKDDVESVRWYRLAASAGNPSAIYNLGQCFLDGVGVAMDYRAAAECMEAGTERGDDRATCELGTMYRFGRGVKQDFIVAAAYHVIAALDGNISAMGNLADYYGEVADMRAVYRLGLGRAAKARVKAEYKKLAQRAGRDGEKSKGP